MHSKSALFFYFPVSCTIPIIALPQKRPNRPLSRKIRKILRNNSWNEESIDGGSTVIVATVGVAVGGWEALKLVGLGVGATVGDTVGD